MLTKRFERAAAALVSGKKVTCQMSEMPFESVQEFRTALQNWCIVEHTDPGDSVSYRVYVTVVSGRVTAAAKKVYFD
jgi:hypothetical protein